MLFQTAFFFETIGAGSYAFSTSLLLIIGPSLTYSRRSGLRSSRAQKPTRCTFNRQNTLEQIDWNSMASSMHQWKPLNMVETFGARFAGDDFMSKGIQQHLCVLLPVGLLGIVLCPQGVSSWVFSGFV